VRKVVLAILDDLRDRAGFCVDCDSQRDQDGLVQDLTDIAVDKLDIEVDPGR
jgi:hypothetical protein